MTVVPICPACHYDRTLRRGDIPDSFTFAGAKLQHPIDGGSLWFCERCSLGFRYPRLNKESLDRLYTSAGTDVWHSPTDIRVDWDIARGMVARANSREVLDVGCFDGRFLGNLNQSNVKALHGIEMNIEAVRIARSAGITIWGDDFSRLADLPNRFDAITAFDVIEHVESPREFLEVCSRALSPGGILIIATGNTASLPWRILGSRNQYCICAEHIAFINPVWCTAESARANLQIQSLELYRRGHFSPLRIAQDAAINLLYAAAPASIQWLRTIGFGQPVSVEARRNPPLWGSAKDHLIACFKKC